MILVTGTLAFDDIATTADHLPADNIKLTSWHTGFGGCGGNLAYTLARLEAPHCLSGYLGALDGQSYLEHLQTVRANTRGIRLIPGRLSARAFITTDPTGHQFTAFHPLEVPRERFVGDLTATLAILTPTLALLAPDVPEHMLAAARLLAGVCPLACYPGQYTAHFSPGEAAELFNLATLVFQNDVEHRVLQPPPHCLTVVTAGAAPVRLLQAGAESHMPVPAAEPVDPTGCGDAFAAAFTAAWTVGAGADAACAQGIRWAQRCLRESGSQRH